MKILVCLFSILFALVSFGDYHEIKTYSQKNWDMSFRGKYFYTDSNYLSSGGTYQSLPSGYGYQLLDMTAGFRATLPDKNWAFFGETQFAYAQAKSPSSTRTNSNITYIKVGTDYILYEDTFTLIPEFTFSYPFVKNATNVDAVALAEGVMEMEAKMLAQIHLGKIIAGVFTGYTYRDESRSSLIPYGVFAEMAGKTWSFGGNLRGYSSISYDKDTNNQAARQSWATNYNGGSFKFFMPNPQLLEANFWSQVKTTKQLNFLFGFGMTLNGANMANGWNALFGMTYRFPTAKEKNTDAELEHFQEETKDGVNQSLFQKQAPVENQVPKENLQNELDKTEMQIELKSNKRKRKK